MAPLILGTLTGIQVKGSTCCFAFKMNNPIIHLQAPVMACRTGTGPLIYNTTVGLGNIDPSFYCQGICKIHGRVVFNSTKILGTIKI